jgi:hypothetical protein
LAVAVTAVTVISISPTFAQVGSGSLPTTIQAVYNLAEAYPATAGTYAANLGIANPQTFAGVCTAPSGLAAIPGTICLKRAPNSFILDVNCFTVIPQGQTGPCFVQAFQLTKKVPGSFKCPDVYGLPHFSGTTLTPYQYFQFGAGVRTWWSLNFTQPGTQFVLDVVSVCRTIAGGNPILHRDRWIWQVVADVNTLQYVIELMHGGAVSTLEVPCILGEDMYEALKNARTALAAAILTGNKTDIGNRIFDFEALIVANCLFVEVLNPVVTFPGTPQFTDVSGFQPPGNLAQTVFFGTGGSAVAGIIDTIENPCCCKLLVDLEWIAIKNGLIGQTPTLPTF